LTVVNTVTPGASHGGVLGDGHGAISLRQPTVAVTAVVSSQMDTSGGFVSVRRQIWTLNVHKSASRCELAHGVQDGCFRIGFTQCEEEYLPPADMDPFDPRSLLPSALRAD
jgi:hypothetical protein